GTEPARKRAQAHRPVQLRLWRRQCPGASVRGSLDATQPLGGDGSLADECVAAADAMSEPAAHPSRGTVGSLHLHAPAPGGALQSVTSMPLVAEQGIAEDERYFGRVSSHTGRPSRRQVSLIAREQIAAHAAALGMPDIAPGAVRANIETMGIDLMSLLGREIELGQAVLLFQTPRDPCAKMDAVAPGLRTLMLGGKQGVMATVVRSGTVRVGGPIGGWAGVGAGAAPAAVNPMPGAKPAPPPTAR